MVTVPLSRTFNPSRLTWHRQIVAVVGVPRAASDYKMKVFVVTREGADLSKEELLDLCRRRLEEYAVPWEIEFREELPKSFTGKVIRRLLTV